MVTATPVRLPNDLNSLLLELADRLIDGHVFSAASSAKGPTAARMNEDVRRWRDTVDVLAAMRSDPLIDGDEVDSWIASWAAAYESPKPW